MTRPFLIGAALLVATPLAAQVAPTPDPDNPTRQSVRYVPGVQVLLTALPGVPLTIAMDPADPVLAIEQSNAPGWTVEAAPSGDGIVLRPGPDAQPGSLTVRTRQRAYEFGVETGETLTSAVLVRFEYGDSAAQPGAVQWSYRLRGDRAVRPAAISDDGAKTRILYEPGQLLPAVFAVGPTGEEQVVNGYMRGEAFVIDRVWRELVFRIDRDKATARRNDEPDRTP